MARREPWQLAIGRMRRFFGSPRYNSILRECDNILSRGYAENFRNKVDENGAPWPPHSPYTVAKYGRHPLLILTGRMHEAATNPNHQEHLREISGGLLRSGIRPSVWYARIHHYGEGIIPRRRVIYANRVTVMRCRDTIGTMAAKQMRV